MLHIKGVCHWLLICVKWKTEMEVICCLYVLYFCHVDSNIVPISGLNFFDSHFFKSQNRDPMGHHIFNAVLMVAVALPPIFHVLWLQRTCGEYLSDNRGDLLSDWTAWQCRTYRESPLLFLNFLFLIHVDLTFYIISLLQRSTWVRSIEI